MKGLIVIPICLVFIVIVYCGICFVDANREPVVVTFFQYKSAPTSAGLVILTSILAGIVMCSLLSVIEILSLHVQNRRLKRRMQMMINQVQASAPKTPRPSAPSEVATSTLPSNETH